MSKMDPAAVKQFEKVTKLNFVLTAIENIVFMVMGKWDVTVLLGSLWGLALTSFFFYRICITIPQALHMEDADLAAKHVTNSQTERLLVLGVGIVAAFKLEFINRWAAIIPLIFTRISIIILNFKGEEEV